MSVIVDFLKAVAGICRTKPLNPDLWEMDHGKARVKVGQVPELSHPGGAVYLTAKDLPEPVLIIARGNGDFVCVADRCTHFRRKLDPVPGKQTLRCCSVSHSTFDFQGEKLGGPARKSLKVYDWKLEDQALVIDVPGA